MITFKQFLNEASMSPLYHATRLSNYERMIRDNKIEASTLHQNVV